MNEATTKADIKNKNKNTNVTEEDLIGGSDDFKTFNDVEAFNVEMTDLNMLNKLHSKAVVNAANAKEDGLTIDVSDILVHGFGDESVKYFSISNDEESFVIYQIMNDIYYRDGEEFFQILEDLKDEIPGQTTENLKTEYSDVSKPLPCISIMDKDDCMFIVSSIFSSICGESYDESNDDMSDISESVKIRRKTRIGTDNDPDESKLVNDIKYGTKSQNDFKQEIEDKQKKDGTVGALDQKQEENVRPQLPNVNLLSENQEIEYEINDRVIFDNELWDVFSVVTDSDSNQRLKITRQGRVMDVSSTDVKPDPEALKNLEVIDQFEFDKNNLNKAPTNDKVQKMKDLNGKTVNCNIIVDNTIIKETVNGNRFKANLRDILEGNDSVRIYVDDDNNEQQWNVQNIQIDSEDWPYAVIASEDDEPLRKIRINPLSYINAKEDTDLVDCILGDKPTQFPKHAIRIIS